MIRTRILNRAAWASLVTLCSAILPSPIWAEILVLTGVNVVPMDDERVISNQTVVIEHGRIVRIAPAAEADPPADAETIDAVGKYLMPGLAEMHAHVPAGGEAQAQYREDVLFLYLANGVTLARGMLGHPAHLDVRRRLAGGEIAGPRLVTSGPGFSAGSVSSAGQGARMVRTQAEAGYDFLKIFWGPTEDQFEAIAEAAAVVGISMAGHVPTDAGVQRALAVGYASIDHFDAYMPSLVDPEIAGEIDGGFFGYRLAPYVSQERIDAMSRKTKEAGVWNVPTESIMHSAFTIDIETVRDERPEFRYMPGRVVDGWFEWVTRFRDDAGFDLEAGKTFIDVRLRLIRALHETGAGLLLGSDAPQWFNVPGFSVHHEMQIMAEAGLSPYEVLKTGTVNPAIFLGQEYLFGRVVEGLQADLVLLDANPLEDLAHARKIAGVIRHGRWFSREEIDRRLEEIATRYAD